jgi:hypothetical protein
MTLEELLESDADTLDKMTPEERLAFCKPFLCITRPELAPKIVKHTPIANMRPSASYDPEAAARKEKIARGLAIAKQFGLDLDI